MAKRPDKSDSPHLHSPIHSGSSAEGTPEAVKRQQQDGLISQQEDHSSDKTPTIVPFPSQAAPADDDRPDPQSTPDTQGDAGHASAAQRLWVSGARRKAAKKSRRKRDWDRFNFREKFTPLERLEREKANYRKEKLLSGQNTQPPDTTATIIPFPSEQAQAAGKPAAPSSDA